MALFLIEREFAEQIGLPDEAGVRGTVDYNNVHELRWLFSFLSADQRKSYCLRDGAPRHLTALTR